MFNGKVIDGWSPRPTLVPIILASLAYMVIIVICSNLLFQFNMACWFLSAFNKLYDGYSLAKYIRYCYYNVFSFFYVSVNLKLNFIEFFLLYLCNRSYIHQITLVLHKLNDTLSLSHESSV
jgi:hypothetical protein